MSESDYQLDSHGIDTSDGRVRFLMVAWGIPPTGSGMAVVVRNLLHWFGTEEAVMLGQVPFKGRITLRGIENHHRIIIPSHPIHWRVKPWLEPFFVIPQAVRAGCAAVRRFQLQAVVAAFPNATLLLAGYLVARRMGLPFLAHMHNLYLETRDNRVEFIFARILQRHIFTRAARVFSMSEGMARYLADHYGLDTIPLVHPLNEPIPQFTDLPRPTVPFKVGFSGNINPGVIGPLKSVIKTIGGDPSYLIVLHTPTDTGHVRKRLGAWANNIVTRDEQDTAGLVASLKGCDVLVLGLANGWGRNFETDCMTQFPTRTLEMLIAERPILVLCPRNYFLAEFFITHECGLLVNDTKPESIRNALLRLCTDVALRSRYVANALQVAQHFRGDLVANQLRRELLRVTG